LRDSNDIPALVDRVSVGLQANGVNNSRTVHVCTYFWSIAWTAVLVDERLEDISSKREHSCSEFYDGLAFSIDLNVEQEKKRNFFSDNGFLGRRSEER
jgi:hypothetical protein